MDCYSNLSLFNNWNWQISLPFWNDNFQLCRLLGKLHLLSIQSTPSLNLMLHMSFRKLFSMSLLSFLGTACQYVMQICMHLMQLIISTMHLKCPDIDFHATGYRLLGIEEPVELMVCLALQLVFLLDAKRGWVTGYRYTVNFFYTHSHV